MNTNLFKKLAIALAIPSMFIATNAMADCSDVGSAEWNELSNLQSQAYQQGDYEESIVYGKRLTLICNQSPVVNFIMSSAYEKQGQKAEAYEYIKRASDHTTDYSVSKTIEEKIWMKRAEYDLPYKKQLAEAEAKIAEKDAALEAKQLEISKVRASAADENKDALNEAWLFYQNELNQVKWAGAGVAIGGAVLAISGAALVGVYHGKANDYFDKLNLDTSDSADKMKDFATNYASNKDKFAQNDSMNKVGIGFLTAGLALGIGGTITATIAHVKSQQITVDNMTIEQNEDAQAEETASVSLQFAPTSVGLSVAF